MKRLFGTDGVRGVVGEGLDANLAFALGVSAAEVLSHGEGPLTVLVGEDTRESSPMLAAALAAGLAAGGAVVRMLGVLPTPAVSYLTTLYRADVGAVVSASHNPHEYNGIKLFGADGEKLSDLYEEAIEAALSHTSEHAARCGRVIPEAGAQEAYLAHLAAIAPPPHELRVALDCANGAFSPIGAQVLSLLSKNGRLLFCEPDGRNINRGCGSMALSALSEVVRTGGFDLGVAFDGDGDRCLLLDECGRVVDGDEILAITALDRHRRGILGSFAVVGTVMSNGGLARLLADEGIGFSAAAVGDRYVREEMRRCGCTLGGEASGHIIFSEHAPTGDGAITALEVLSVMLRRCEPLSALAARMKRYPARTVNLPMPMSARSAVEGDPEIASARYAAEQMLAGEGRLVLRPSGTEPYLRITVEARDAYLLDAVCDALVKKVAHSLEKYNSCK